MFVAFGEIKAETERLVRLERRNALNGDAFFTYIDNLVKVERGVARFGCECDVRGCLDLVADTPATVGDNGSQRRSHNSHGQGP